MEYSGDYLTEYYDFVSACELHELLVTQPERDPHKPTRNKVYEHKSYHLIILPDNKLIRVKRSNRDRSGYMEKFYNLAKLYFPTVRLELDRLKACWMGFNIEWSLECDDNYYDSIPDYLHEMEQERLEAERRKDAVKERRAKLSVLRLP